MKIPFTITYIIYWVLIGGICFFGFIRDALRATKRNDNADYANWFQKYTMILFIATFFALFMALLWGSIFAYATDGLINTIVHVYNYFYK